MPNNPLIVTAKMDADSFDYFNHLRQKYFPVARNFLSAHITLFHQLPSEQLIEIERTLKEVASRQYEFPLFFPKVKFFGQGSGIEVESTELISLQVKLANRWSDYLTAQDKLNFQPHITVQNKVPPEAARKSFEELKNIWETRRGKAIGLQLWNYQGGPWQLANEFSFYKTNDY